MDICVIKSINVKFEYFRKVEATTKICYMITGCARYGIGKSLGFENITVLENDTSSFNISNCLFSLCYI
jgi:hypothetical protein